MNLPIPSYEPPVAILNEQCRIEMETLLYLAEQELHLNDSVSDSIVNHCIDWMLLLFQRNNTTPVKNKFKLEQAYLQNYRGLQYDNA